jgi:hypothetical protein
MNLLSIEGYHGTNAAHAESIQINNFKPSVGDKEWLGNGTYFFIHGISNDRKPEIAAADWVKASAWDNNSKCNKYVYCCVLKAITQIYDNYLLDLTTADGMEIFNYYRQEFNNKLAKSRRIFSKNGSLQFRDGELINDMRTVKDMRIDAVKNSSYIKFESERIHQIDFRTHNCTILVVHDANKNIEKTAIEIIQNFRI